MQYGLRSWWFGCGKVRRMLVLVVFEGSYSEQPIEAEHFITTSTAYVHDEFRDIMIDVWCVSSFI